MDEFKREAIYDEASEPRGGEGVLGVPEAAGPRDSRTAGSR